MGIRNDDFIGRISVFIGEKPPLQATDVAVLAVCAEHPTWSIQPLNCAQILGMRQDVATRTLSRLRKGGYLDDDNRLTSSGWAFFPDLAPEAPKAPPPPPNMRSARDAIGEPLYWSKGEEDLARRLGYCAWEPTRPQPYRRDAVWTPKEAGTLLSMNASEVMTCTGLPIGFPRMLTSLDRRMPGFFLRTEILAFKKVLDERRQKRRGWPLY